MLAHEDAMLKAGSRDT